MAWDKSNEETADLIGGDRRNDRRYGLQLDVKWKLIRRRRYSKRAPAIRSTFPAAA